MQKYCFSEVSAHFHSKQKLQPSTSEVCHCIQSIQAEVISENLPSTKSFSAH
jgi:hypothetical protein